MFLTLLAIASIGQAGTPSKPGVMGAQGVLRGLGATVSQPAKPSAWEALLKEFDAFSARSHAMSTEVAAEGWLALLRKWEAALSARSAVGDDRWQMRQNMEPLVVALPRPETWPIIRNGLAKLTGDRPAQVMLALFELLLGHDREVVRITEALTKPTRSDWEPMSLGDVLRLQLKLALRLKDAALVEKLLVRTAGQQAFYFFEGVPDIVGALGVEKSRPILTRFLEALKEPISEFNGVETRRLARSIVLANLDRMKAPQWSLAEGPEARKYVVALAERFGNATVGGNAQTDYLLYLLESGRTDAAVSLLSNAETSHAVSYDSLDRQQANSLLPPLLAAAQRDPGNANWEGLLQLAKVAGDVAAVTRLLDEALAANPPPAARRALLAVRGRIAAEAGDEKSAIALYSEASRIAAGRTSYDGVTERLVDLAKATGSAEATEAAVVALKTKGASAQEAEPVFDLLLSQGRLADAQRFILDMESSPANAGDDGPMEATPVMLAEIYYRAERPSDVLYLLDHYPHWPERDLYDMVTLQPNQAYRREFWRPPLGFFAAWAFANTGKKDLAIRTLHSVLSFILDEDNSYELLNALEGEPALVFYDRLAATDAFAPRPLVWKADLLLRLGRLREAEATARAAIAMDPSDGDASPGRRLTSYAVLGRILKAEGKEDEAQTLERLVQSIRVSERADGYRRAGLLPQALELYRESARLFADAYCVHARMGITLAEQGRDEESLQEFRRAYELMPESFGRMESLCFGCEGTFTGEGRSRVARSVFESLARTMPNNPQAQYLLGLILVDARDYRGALASFESAVSLDPKYLSALLKILDLGDQGVVSGDRLQAVALQILRLDPLLLHGGYGALKVVDDYDKLWRLATDAAATLPPAPRPPLYRLAAPVLTERNPYWIREFNQSGPADAPLRKSPGAFLAQSDLIRSILQINPWSRE